MTHEQSRIDRAVDGESATAGLDWSVMVRLRRDDGSVNVSGASERDSGILESHFATFPQFRPLPEARCPGRSKARLGTSPTWTQAFAALRSTPSFLAASLDDRICAHAL